MQHAVQPGCIFSLSLRICPIHDEKNSTEIYLSLRTMTKSVMLKHGVLHSNRSRHTFHARI